MTLYAQWLAAKEAERQAVEQRRAIEDQLIAELRIAETDEGTRTVEAGEYKVKITCRMNRRVDADALQEIAAEHGITDHLGDLFRWKPEINAKAWKSADESITTPLLAAITTQPGRPSFAIELNQE